MNINCEKFLYTILQKWNEFVQLIRKCKVFPFLIGILQDFFILETKSKPITKKRENNA
ncbi:hypothetical protein ASZ90_004246 [hydrocarbon metagenome]|uniref:Uncharacterized protein n=1 Tax=hydrocarbon metagenome TaxID=938273 RepID=A0A0W8FYB9_9ZZZZ